MGLKINHTADGVEATDVTHIDANSNYSQSLPRKKLSIRWQHPRFPFTEGDSNQVHPITRPSGPFEPSHVGQFKRFALARHGRASSRNPTPSKAHLSGHKARAAARI